MDASGGVPNAVFTLGVDASEADGKVSLSETWVAASQLAVAAGVQSECASRRQM